MNNCKKNNIFVDPYREYVIKALAYNEYVSNKRRGNTFLKYKIVGLEPPQNLKDLDKLNKMYKDFDFATKFDSQQIARSFDDIKLLQKENKEKLKVFLESKEEPLEF